MRGVKSVLTRKERDEAAGGVSGGRDVLNVVIMSQLSYSAVMYMEEPQFCGQSCHVMKPEFTAYRVSPHARVLCVECHVTPGATGWVQSKVAGTRQLLSVIFNNYPRPIQSAMESNRLIPASETCEKCHWPAQFGGARLRVIPQYADDEKNTLSQTVLMMMVGGGGVRGIHGSHFGPGVTIRYASTDSSRQTIPWVEYRNSSTNEVREYAAEGVKPERRGKTGSITPCNAWIAITGRRTHSSFRIGRSIAPWRSAGFRCRCPSSRRRLWRRCKSSMRAAKRQDRRSRRRSGTITVRSNPRHYQSRSEDVDTAANAILAIYNQNVFPDLGVTWGTYKNNLGHTDFPGCFRCHDEAHTSAGGKTITQDCGACHEMVAASEASPEVLRTLGVQERISGLQKK